MFSVNSEWPVYDTNLLHLSDLFLFNFLHPIGPTQKMNLFQSITSALDNTLASDPTAGRLLKQETGFHTYIILDSKHFINLRGKLFCFVTFSQPT